MRRQTIITLFVILTSLATGCAAGRARFVGSDDEIAEIDAREASAVIEFLNAPSTTLGLLDYNLALDVRAARNLIQSRPFNDLREVAHVRWVGPKALRSLVDWVRFHGWVQRTTASISG